jgi:acyl CoA:acetate/3-ketoacid CoA transferase alpha subunit
MERNFEQSSATTHLTDEQFADLLLGANPAAVQDHLKACSACAEEADRVAGAIGSFEQQSRLWAERRASTNPMLTSTPAPAFAWMYRRQAWTAAALAIALAAGFGVAARNHHAPVAQTQVAKVQPAPVVSPSTLKADNALLSAIDGELRADESTPAIAYGLMTTAHGVRNHSAKRVISE